ncbi:Predicted membrane protein [uncultured Roseburia sp.]|uniref:DUF445 family protein n=1 Tax=Brotonthovivens ammoniilytica TaxID=2981725 RepID=A0ABT2TJW2_9FIRM|nr:DUF445 family protein [Brotonthovivens ammoniilytica]MCU6762480.1 DUF445 family protein [Brotonthovivens ammoniilytica]SCI73170.1 Predicted membrane protein [uncultured Roseburia sp.]
MNEVIHFLAGPVVGGIIGYFTNFIAIKMLFRPRKEIKIGKYVLPFTPGIIPKRKDKLARAIGEAVAQQVFTEEDIEEIFLSEGMKDSVVESLLASLGQGEHMYTLVELLGGVMSEDEFEEFQNNLDRMIYRRVHLTINRSNIAERISEECTKILKEKTNGLTSKVLNPGRISSISDYMGTRVQQYAKENVETVIMPLLRDETVQVFVKPLDQLLSEMQADEERLREIIGKVYEKFMSQHSKKMVKLFDIASLTEKKIIEFQVEEIEALVDQTIHREMQAVINLGAVLGVIIGFVNTFI